MAKTKTSGKIMQVVGISAGAIGGGMIGKFVPIQNEKIKAALPLVAGFFLVGRKGIMGDLGAGLIAAGAVKLGQAFGIGAMDYPVMDLDEVDTLEGIDESPVNGSEEFEESEM
jgi:hypothetical protein